MRWRAPLRTLTRDLPRPVQTASALPRASTAICGSANPAWLATEISPMSTCGCQLPPRGRIELCTRVLPRARCAVHTAIALPRASTPTRGEKAASPRRDRSTVACHGADARAGPKRDHASTASTTSTATTPTRPPTWRDPTRRQVVRSRARAPTTCSQRQLCRVTTNGYATNDSRESPVRFVNGESKTPSGSRRARTSSQSPSRGYIDSTKPWLPLTVFTWPQCGRPPSA